MIFVEDTAAESPAASANGTVKPSAIPITTSRTDADPVKCFSTCGIVGMPFPSWLDRSPCDASKFKGYADDPSSLGEPVIGLDGLAASSIALRKPSGPATAGIRRSSTPVPCTSTLPKSNSLPKNPC
jgi:hypothetical protein